MNYLFTTPKTFQLKTRMLNVKRGTAIFRSGATSFLDEKIKHSMPMAFSLECSIK